MFLEWIAQSFKQFAAQVLRGRPGFELRPCDPFGPCLPLILNGLARHSCPFLVNGLEVQLSPVKQNPQVIPVHAKLAAYLILVLIL
jgi:hypothetical protein